MSLTEKMMEEQIISNPAKYIEEGLTLLNRQFRIGPYIFDLLFKDRHGSKLIVELQRGTLDRNHTYKILDYYDEYKTQNPDSFVELMIIANKIPRERRDRLSSYGIAFKEIPETDFLHITPGEIIPPGNGTKPNNESQVNEDKPGKGDFFKGKVNDLSLVDSNGWRRRDITFFKHDVINNKSYGYPCKKDQIILIDEAGNHYELRFSKPESDNAICLGTPSKLKQWYQRKGFQFQKVNPEDYVYFEYTGNSNEFLILTEDEYKKKSVQRKF